MRERATLVVAVVAVTVLATAGPALGAALDAGADATECQGRTEVPKELDIGTAVVGESTTASYTFKNPSDRSIQFSSTIKGPDAEAFAIVSGGGGAVGPGDCVTVTIKFSPDEARDYDAILQASTDDTTASTGLDGQGKRKKNPEISLNPSTANFGNVTVGSTATKTFVIENTGNAPLAVDSVSIVGGSSNASFSIKGAVPDVVGPGQKATVKVAYSPDTGGAAASARLAVDSNATNVEDGTVGATLQGQAIEPGDLAISNASLTFGTVSVGDSKQLSVTLTNDGGQPVSISKLVIKGDAAGAFTVVDSPEEVPAGGSATVTVEFEPSEAESASALLAVKTSSGSVPGLDVSLSGTGTAPNIKVAPSSVNFGKTVTSDTIRRSIRIVNRGSEPLKITSLNIRGQNPGMFSVATGSLPITVPAGGSTSIAVVFSPSTTGSFSASLVIGSNAPNAPSVVYLSNTITTVDQSTETQGNTTTSEVSVSDAQANQTITLTFGGDGDGSALWYAGAAGARAVGGNVSLTTMNLTIEEGGDFHLGVAASEQKLSGLPTFYLQPRNGTEPVGYLNVTHTIDEENIKQVEFLHRVSKARLNQLDAEIEDYALYRYHDGEWVELNTTVVREAPSYYVVRATSPGLSDFTAGVKQPKFRLVTATVTVTKINIGEDVGVRVTIRNDGGAEGTYTTKLILDGEVVAQKAATVGADSKRVVTFQQEITEAGTYTVKVNNETINDVTVTKEEVSGTAESTPAATSTPERSSTPGFGPVVAAVALVAAALLGRRRT